MPGSSSTPADIVEERHVLQFCEDHGRRAAGVSVTAFVEDKTVFVEDKTVFKLIQTLSL